MRNPYYCLMKDHIEKLQKEIATTPLDDLDQRTAFKQRYLSREGAISLLFGELRKLPAPEKKSSDCFSMNSKKQLKLATKLLK